MQQALWPAPGQAGILARVADLALHKSFNQATPGYLSQPNDGAPQGKRQQDGEQDGKPDPQGWAFRMHIILVALPRQSRLI